MAESRYVLRARPYLGGGVNNALCNAADGLHDLQLHAPQVREEFQRLLACTGASALISLCRVQAVSMTRMWVLHHLQCQHQGCVYR